jgi:flagellar assembly factor FliW
MKGKKKKMREMVNDQTANYAAKLLKNDKQNKTKQKPVLEEQNYSLSSDVTALASSPACLFLLGRFRGLL